MGNDAIKTLVEIIEESANIVDSSSDLTTVINRIKTGQRLSLLLEQNEKRGLHTGEPKSSGCIGIFFDSKEILIHKALKKALDKTLSDVEMTKNIQTKIGCCNSFITELNNHRDEYSEDNIFIANCYENQILEKIALLKKIRTVSNEYEINKLGDIHFINVPRFNFSGMATFSPKRRYLVAGHNHMIAAVDVQNNHLMFTYDIFAKLDHSSIVVTDHPFIAIRDIVSIGQNRQNDIYLMNHRSDILLKVSVDANVCKLTVSDDGVFVAAQTTDNKIRLFKVDEMTQVAFWNIPNKIAIELIIDLNTSEVRVVDYQNHVYSYSFANL